MFIQITRGVFVNKDRVKAVIPLNSVMAKQMREAANFSNKTLNLTYGAQARTVVITDSGHVFLLGEKVNKVRQKLLKKKEQDQQSH
ncbi:MULTISPECIES: DUF370 domain-containing protein [Pseudothermotoga]|jgi:regulator of extracellular matrix RemA (YlzA/DUF370 family)|uniref:Regulatory protein n=1 Tax=Pseudothermotoga lettingae (strain ATCC BAA-301 / DSM 14385 / NBRC 107922 / TMO) TaxID=416591 RepID=A8F4N1_PSELT|nr:MULTISPECIES: DUF370 domain-containing protein [Pseudothermotoga]ABV33115.1 hypothetical protein Tlet_0548 [Pseudothermotoga lettingae TMO]KUK20309.1 MAG: Uncharacterized protein XD56_1772 [Pseudothermotoga lettingae]MDI3495450.1 hypothetical protein [Pseudothermotoga sp.]MDK2884121.1 hypothetical protein [Pseudothermotoga sp.]GLI47884.1 hypothetical protein PLETTINGATMO_00530 [Pseudothermotoga lettingae TMO]